MVILLFVCCQVWQSSCHQADVRCLGWRRGDRQLRLFAGRRASMVPRTIHSGTLTISIPQKGAQSYQCSTD